MVRGVPSRPPLDENATLGAFHPHALDALLRERPVRALLELDLIPRQHAVRGLKGDAAGDRPIERAILSRLQVAF